MSDVPQTPPADDTITPAHEEIIRKHLEGVMNGTISLDDLTKIVFDDQTIDGRSKKGRALKKWIVAKGHKIKTSKYEPEGPFVLADEHVEFITNNIDSMRPMEIARTLFPGKKITPLNKEYLAICTKIREIRPEAVPESDRMAEGPYEPPKSIYRLVPRINEYVSKYKIENVKPLPQDEKQISDRDLKCLKKLLGYMNTHTFFLSINIYELVHERELFESRFIRYTYDKPDLTEEEVDQYISVCDKYVALHQIRKNIQTLQKEININLEAATEEKKKVAMSYIELLNSYRAKEKDAEDVLERTVKALVGTRDKRLAGQQANNATVLNLVQAWQDIEKRRELLELAKRQREAEQDAVKRLSNMDAVVALIAGLSKDNV